MAEQLICQKHRTILVYDNQLAQLVCYPCREATGIGIGKAVPLPSGHCDIHNLAYDGQCGPCAREAYEKEKKVQAFRYEVYRFKGADIPRSGNVWSPDGLAALHEYLNEMGKRGEEVISVQVVDSYDAMVVARVHRPD